MQSITFNYTAAPETWTVLRAFRKFKLKLQAQKVGGINGGNGAIINGFLNVVPGQTIQLNVGGEGACPASGYNGGGSGSNANNQANASCGGGGASDLRIPPYQSSDRIVAAGGGGMGGGDTDSDGGSGGCTNGGDGTGVFGIGGDGANQNNGGNGGAPWSPNGNSGVNGVFYNGGAGASDPCFNLGPGGGGGGILWRRWRWK